MFKKELPQIIVVTHLVENYSSLGNGISWEKYILYNLMHCGALSTCLGLHSRTTTVDEGAVHWHWRLSWDFGIARCGIWESPSKFPNLTLAKPRDLGTVSSSRSTLDSAFQWNSLVRVLPPHRTSGELLRRVGGGWDLGDVKGNQTRSSTSAKDDSDKWTMTDLSEASEVAIVHSTVHSH